MLVTAFMLSFIPTIYGQEKKNHIIEPRLIFDFIIFLLIPGRYVFIKLSALFTLHCDWLNAAVTHPEHEARQ